MFKDYLWLLILILMVIVVLLILILKRIFKSAIEVDLYMDSNDFLEDIMVENPTKDQLREIIPSEIIIEAQQVHTPRNTVKSIESDSTEIRLEEEVISVPNAVTIKVKSKGGKHGPKMKTKTIKEKFDVQVSNLRRYFYNEGIDAEKLKKLLINSF